MAAAAMTDAAPLVSVCIANYNGIPVIDACLNSVHQQQGDMEIEILVHDDASTDGSVDHLRQQYPQVRLICSTDNVGFCKANNRMVQAARGEYLLLLNNDAALFPDALQALLAEARGLHGPAILTLPQYDATSGALVDRGCLLDLFYNPVPNLDPRRQEVAMVIGACLWLPRSLWRELGGFPEWFGSIAEDMYLCCHARLAGYAVRTLDVSGYRHWQGKSFGGNRLSEQRLRTTFRRRALSERNKTLVMVMMSPWFLLVWLLPMHLLWLLVEGLLLSLLQRDLRFLRVVYLPAMAALLLRRRQWWRVRRGVQAVRQAGSVRASLAVTTLWPRKLSMLWRYGLPKVS
jgi:GT2 family glycosyltransferase